MSSTFIRIKLRQFRRENLSHKEMLMMTKSQRESVGERKEIKDETHQLQDK